MPLAISLYTDNLWQKKALNLTLYYKGYVEIEIRSSNTSLRVLWDVAIPAKIEKIEKKKTEKIEKIEKLKISGFGFFWFFSIFDFFFDFYDFFEFLDFFLKITLSQSIRSGSDFEMD